MTAALSLADQGFRCHLSKNRERWAGTCTDIHSTLEHDDIAGFHEGLDQAGSMDHRNIKLHLNCEVEKVNGHIGNFTVGDI